MQKIQLLDVIPSFWEGRDPGTVGSGVWACHRELEKGQAYLIKAASGQGKTTLCHFLLGLRQDYQGSILFDGETVRGFSARQWTQIRATQLSSMFQGLMLFDELTPLEQIRLIPDPSRYDERRVCEALDRLGLSDKLRVKLRYLSFGQKQRVAFVRMLFSPADFLILDEPVSHLDRDNAERLAELLSERCAQDHPGVIVTSIGQDLPFSYDQEVRL